MQIPNFIKPLDIDKIRDEIINEFKIKSDNLDYIPLIGDDYVTLIDIFLYRINNFLQEINYKIANNYINFSTGEYLDELVALIGIKRHEATKPIAKVKITSSSPTFLAKGTKFIDLEGHNAYLLEDIHIQKEAEAYIELDFYSNENYQTNILEIPNLYIKSIDIIEPFKGFSALESDEDLRKRFLLALHDFSTAGSKKAYLFYILKIEGVKKADVYFKSPGVVKIIYFSLLSDDITELKIKEILKDRIPLTDKIEISPAKIINLDLEIEISLTNEVLFSSVLNNAMRNLTNYFNSLDIGFTPHTSKIIDIAFNNNEFINAVDVKTQIPNIDKDSIIKLNTLQITKKENV